MDNKEEVLIDGFNKPQSIFNMPTKTISVNKINKFIRNFDIWTRRYIEGMVFLHSSSKIVNGTTHLIVEEEPFFIWKIKMTMLAYELRLSTQGWEQINEDEQIIIDNLKKFLKSYENNEFNVG